MLVSREQGPPAVDRKPDRHGGWAPRRCPVSLVPTTTLWGLRASTPEGTLCHCEPGSGLHHTTCRPQGSSTWQLANLEEEGAGRRQAGQFIFTPPPLSLSALGLSMSQWREQSVYKSHSSLRELLLSSCRKKATTPLSKNKTNITEGAVHPQKVFQSLVPGHPVAGPGLDLCH